MKKLLIALLFVSVLAYLSCKKNTASAPTACFTVSALDSSKVASFDSLRIDSIIKVQASGYFIDVQEGTPTTVYKRTLIFKNCGSSNYNVIYTGDSTHIKVDPANPGTVTGLQTALDFSGSQLVYKYKTAGTYMVTVVSSNVADFGKEVSKSTVAKTIVLK